LSAESRRLGLESVAFEVAGVTLPTVMSPRWRDAWRNAGEEAFDPHGPGLAGIAHVGQRLAPARAILLDFLPRASGWGS
jgi:hypothetical protein